MEKKEMLPLRSQAGGAHAYCILHSTHTFNATFEDTNVLDAKKDIL